jgi:flavorubredoxin
MTTEIAEIAPDVFRISTYNEQIGIAFCQFLVRDEEPLLFHTGMRSLFPEVREAVGKVIDPARLRWIGFSHFEADECGALNEWLAIAPQAEPATGLVGALTSINDFSAKPARVLGPDEVFSTGRRRFRYRPTPHVPHGWDAGVLYEETERVLFCSDLLHQEGNNAPSTESDVLDRVQATLIAYQQGPFANYQPITTRTNAILDGLAALEPRVLATMHGSSFVGDGGRALRDLKDVMRRALGVAEPALA